LILILIFMMWE